jgi:hypothetical protein
MLNFELPKSTANFLEPGEDGCELRVTSCEEKTLLRKRKNGDKLEFGLHPIRCLQPVRRIIHLA